MCQSGIWFTSTAVTGPWIVAAYVPSTIYTIPPSSPLYNLTYVQVYGSTPTVVYTGYTPGYTSMIVYNGVVVYGTGYVYSPWIGSVWYGPPDHLRLRRQHGLHALHGLGLRVRRRLRLRDGRRDVRLRLGLLRLGLGRRVGRLLRTLRRRGVGLRRRRGLGPGLRALVLGQRLQPVGLDLGGHAERRRLQRLDRKRVARPGGLVLQLEDRARRAAASGARPTTPTPATTPRARAVRRTTRRRARRPREAARPSATPTPAIRSRLRTER